jgi:chromosome segregation ATPase
LFVKIDDERKKELETTNDRFKDLEKRYAQISKSFSSLKTDLEEKNSKLTIANTTIESKIAEINKLEKKLLESNEMVSNQTKENQKIREECEKLKLTLDETISSNSITLENLQRVLASEKKFKEESQIKVQKLKTRMTELEDTNKLNETTKMELELKLKEKVNDYERVKSEYDKIQNVLSYIKANT